jgi:hypothetical protein
MVQDDIGPEGRKWSRDSAHLHDSHHACFTIPLPKPDMRVSSSSGFPSLQTVIVTTHRHVDTRQWGRVTLGLDNRGHTF